MTDKLDFVVNGRGIGPEQTPFVIAEMSGNHNQSLPRALELVDAAAASGAHAVKLQTYTADTMTLDVKDGDFTISDKDSLWSGSNLYELYQQAQTPWVWHKPLFERARAHGMLAFSTPFDETAVDFLESLGAPIYKIASFENTDLPLIARVGRTGKPMIISTGMASVGEIAAAVDCARGAGCKDLVLLKCTSTYPASPQDSNLATIAHMRELFGCQIGLSDHTMGCGVAVAAVALGATVIEKHFTLARADGGVDSAFSLEPAEFKELVIESERCWQSIGMVKYGSASAQEEKSKQFRRSLYVAQDMRAGEIFDARNVRPVRPGMGLPTRHLSRIIGRKARRDLAKGTALAWDLVD